MSREEYRKMIDDLLQQITDIEFLELIYRFCKRLIG